MAKQTSRQKEWYERNKEKAIQRAVDWQKDNPEKYSARLKNWRQENLERERQRARDWKENNKERHLASSREYSRKHAKEISEKRKAARRALKKTVLDAYGGECACCGEGTHEFLTLDHINGDGAEHRRSLGLKGGRSYVLYKHLIEQGFPSGFRVLCFNCNSALGFYGYCPHNPESTDGVPVRRRKEVA